MVALPVTANAQAGEEGATSTGLAIHVRRPLPPQLMLRASYHLYLDADANNGATSDQTEAKAEELKSAQADDEVATSESSLEEPVPSPAPGTEVPDIDTLSQRAIEHYEIQSEENKKYERRRRRALTIGVPILAAAVLGTAVAAGVGASSFD